MLRRTSCFLSLYSGGGGAASSWFGRSSLSDTWWGCTKTLIVGLVGIGLVNQFCRGNVWGYCEDESQMVAPVLQLRRKSNPPQPEGYGFVGDETSSR